LSIFSFVGHTFACGCPVSPAPFVEKYDFEDCFGYLGPLAITYEFED